MDNYDSDYGMQDDLDSMETVVSRQPKSDDYNTFVQRNDPQPLIERFKLRLLNAWIDEYEEEDEKTGRMVKKEKLRFHKNTQPLANPQGVEQIISYVESFINNHCVQAHITSEIDYNRKMLAYADDITMHFISNRTAWNLSLGNCDILIANTISTVELFLSRALYNKEREGYTDGFKEVVDRKIQPTSKPSVVQRFGSFLGGGGSQR